MVSLYQDKVKKSIFFSVLIFPNILKVTGSKHYSRFCFDFFHSPRLMACAPNDLTRCWGLISCY